MKERLIITLSVLLFVACNNTPQFTCIAPDPNDSLDYDYYILVDNAPSDTLERIKMMIDYYDSVGMSIPELRKKNIMDHTMFFRKNTRTVLKRFIEGLKEVCTGINTTSMGWITIYPRDFLNMSYSEEENYIISDSTKWYMYLYYEFGYEPPETKLVDLNGRGYPLYDQGIPNWWERYKDSTKVERVDAKYYDGRVINHLKKLQGDILP